LSFTDADIGKTFRFDYSATVWFRDYDVNDQLIPGMTGSGLGSLSYALEIIPGNLPEPASIMFLGVGGLIVATRRR
jgi:hypothetical protein